MIKLILVLSLAAVSLAAITPARVAPTFLNNPDPYRYQQYQNNPYYNTQNPYNFNKDRYYQNNNADYYQRYNQRNNYYNNDYNRYYQDGSRSGILKFENDAGPDGSYHYGYETENGISVEEQGSPRALDAARSVAPVVVQGHYRYTSPEGVPVEISYTADEFGYHPTGTIIPGNGQSNLAYRGVYTTVRPVV
ncbi:unnamed protein product [Phaedon cochleariae]|uniref:Uncharacterized protein n=1 Tax=Phaedon cochleariae TaxID=80249 RepID=A0A9P0DSE0_PHACE|nr:unnamed protein product [Phaedon cochleariae]